MGKSSPTKIQAKHIPAGMLIDLVRNLSNVPNIRSHWGRVYYDYDSHPNLRMICRIWDTVPPKVIQAKLRLLIEKYHILEGCACGCSSSISINEYAPYEIRRTISREGWVDMIVRKEIVTRDKTEEQIAQYMKNYFGEGDNGSKN
jgi:hypothetical protein